MEESYSFISKKFVKGSWASQCLHYQSHLSYGQIQVMQQMEKSDSPIPPQHLCISELLFEAVFQLKSSLQIASN